MAAHVLRLRVALLVGALRGDSGHVTRASLGLILLVGGTAAVCWGLLTLKDAPAEVVLAITVLGGAAVTLGFALAPLIGGVDDPLDPRRFAVLGLPRGRLAAALAVAGFISVPTMVLTAVAVCTALVEALTSTVSSSRPTSSWTSTPSCAAELSLRPVFRNRLKPESSTVTL